MTEYGCYACGHTMKLVSHEIKKADNGRAYLRSYYKCLFEDCPTQKAFGNGVIVKDTLFGVRKESDFKIEKI